MEFKSPSAYKTTNASLVVRLHAQWFCGEYQLEIPKVLPPPVRVTAAAFEEWRAGKETKRAALNLLRSCRGVPYAVVDDKDATQHVYLLHTSTVSQKRGAGACEQGVFCQTGPLDAVLRIP